MGKVPAVVYGRDIEPTPVAVSARELNSALRGQLGANVLLRLDVDGAEHLALARQIQRHPWRGEIRHVDFITVTLTETVEAEVAIHLEGESVGVQEGGIVETVRSTIRLAALVTNIPSVIVLDITKLDVGDHLRVADLPALEGVEYLDDPDELLVTCRPPSCRSRRSGRRRGGGRGRRRRGGGRRRSRGLGGVLPPKADRGGSGFGLHLGIMSQHLLSIG